jgi:hypothetical protein
MGAHRSSAPGAPATILLLLALALHVVVARDTPKDNGIVYGQEAIRLLGLADKPMGVQAIGTRTSTRLIQLLTRDKDLGVMTSNRRLVYTCRGLLRGASSRTMQDQQQGAGGNMTMQHQQAPQRAAGRDLLQVPGADMKDPLPALLELSATGVPLLHRWVGEALKRGTTAR